MTPDPRDELAEAVQYGRMTPNEAEAKLKELGLPPLAPQPDPINFRPMAEVWWTLPMAVAWIAWRTSADVREAWDAFRREQSYWKHERWRVGYDGPIYEGWELKTRPPASLLELALAEKRRGCEGALPKDALSVADARKLLWQALGQKALEATGLRTEDGSRVPIPDYEWHDLAGIEERGRDVVRHRERHGYSKRGYDEVAFKRRDVVMIWQPSRIEARGISLPATVSPHGPGYMPLYCAAQWIATRGGTFSFEPNYQPIWEAAYSELLDRIASNDVAVTATLNGRSEKLDGYVFAGIRVSYPFSDVAFEFVLSDEMYLLSFPYLDDEHWRGGFDDRLDGRSGPHCTRIMVAKPDIARWWTFDNEIVEASGAPGRPSSMQLVRAEFEARWKRGEVEKAAGAEAAALSTWLAKTHPKAPRLTPKTIRNKLGPEHLRRWHARK